MASNTDIKSKSADLKAGKLTCTKNVQYFLSNIEKNDGKLNIVLQVDDNVKDIAKKLDKKRENKEKLGSLYGLCFIFKSNISIKGMNILCASKTLENYKGSFNADVVRRIQEEDGIVLGIANNDEFASGSSGESSAFGPTINPKTPSRNPGGSSSGSAAAVAADFCDIALGSDTGGSIRNPASHCGIVGIKPSYGRVSRYGLIDLSMSFDQIGPFSADIYGSALTMSVISGYSQNDATTFDIKVEDYSKLTPKKTYTIGIIKAFDKLITDDRIRKLFNSKVSELKKLGHKVIEVDVNNIDLAIQAYYPIVYTEFFSGTRKFDSVKYASKIDETAGEEVLRRIYGGMEISKSEFDGAYYKKALKVKEIIADEFTRVFKDVDFILTPVTPELPHKLGSKVTPEEMYAIDAFTIPANLGGICGGVVSKDTIEEDKEQVHVGLQIFADKFKESNLFQGLTLLNSLD